MGSVIGVDLGGTKILVAAVDETGSATEHIKHATPTEGPEAVVELIVESVLELDPEPAAIGLGVPGPVIDGIVLEAPNLVGWGRDVPLADMISPRIGGAPVVVGNDANLGTLGEARHGAGQGSTDVLGCWLGTGVGGGLVLDGRMHQGVHGVAGELGHVPVAKANPRRCACGRWGCLEAYAGRAGMESAIDRFRAEGRLTRIPEIMAEKGKDRITSSVWKAAWKDRDEVAVVIIEEAVAALSVALGGALNILDVDTVVFGGGLTEKFGQDHVDWIAEATRPRLMAPDVERRWVVATLGDDAGVVGAAELARSVTLAV
ncbi:ROK family protein [Euzebya sp.]|uniref:ROK family protein n=1 Tax=Euzebya sp. TaxID=1971409 RepID=UPI003517E1D3